MAHQPTAKSSQVAAFQRSGRSGRCHGPGGGNRASRRWSSQSTGRPSTTAQTSHNSHQSSKRMAVSTSSPSRPNTRGNRSRIGNGTSPCNATLVRIVAAVMANSKAARCSMRRRPDHSARQAVARVVTIAKVASRISASGPKPGGSGNRTTNGNATAPSSPAVSAVVATRGALNGSARRADNRYPSVPRSHRCSDRGRRRDKHGSRPTP